MSIFGPRIIGKEKYEEQKAKAKKTSNIYGPRVTGGVKRTKPLPAPRKVVAEDPVVAGDALAAITDISADTADISADTAPEGQIPAGTDTNDNGYLSEAEVADALQRQPNLYGRLLALELQRPERLGGPRKGVSKKLLAFEEKREGGPRTDVVAKLKAVIG